ncbi:hypothetical protein RI367_004965 [Sorochytrium milnesiophthora]
MTAELQQPDSSNSSASAASVKATTAQQLAERQLQQRQKQLDFGKNTIGYQRYTELVPREKRQKGHPTTPDKRQQCSTRSWVGQVRRWRRKLHKWDPPEWTCDRTSEAGSSSTPDGGWSDDDNDDTAAVQTAGERRHSNKSSVEAEWTSWAAAGEVGDLDTAYLHGNYNDLMDEQPRRPATVDDGKDTATQ